MLSRVPGPVQQALVDYLFYIQCCVISSVTVSFLFQEHLRLSLERSAQTEGGKDASCPGCVQSAGQRTSREAQPHLLNVLGRRGRNILWASFRSSGWKVPATRTWG